jgi:hypothetical protein
VTAPLAVPAFTLSSVAETRTVNTAATGFTINSTGGAIASFAINTTPPGMSFNTTTGALTGTPNTVSVATAYTITATNTSGSATQTFTLTVIAVVYTVGQTGPGGGIIFYYLAAGFNCGPSFTPTGSPTGEQCHYLEVAPSTWGTPNDRSAMPWAIVRDSLSNISEIPDEIGVSDNSFNLIGLGYKYSNYVVTQNGNAYNSASNIYAAGNARAYLGGGLNDWYLPSSAELNTLCQWSHGVAQSFTASCSGTVATMNASTYGAQSSGFQNISYWASSENGVSNNGKITVWGSGGQAGLTKSQNAYVRPIRAF